MQPSLLAEPLIITKGATFRQAFFLQQPELVYLPIAQIEQTTPVQFTVPSHGIPPGWPIWIEGVTSLTEMNRPRTGSPTFAEVVDANTLRMNQVDARGRPRGQGGNVVMQTPVDLTNSTATLQVVDAQGEILLTTNAVGATKGVLEFLVRDTTKLTWSRGRFRLWLTNSLGDTDLWLTGEVIVKEPF